jgi:hypothetical protein
MTAGRAIAGGNPFKLCTPARAVINVLQILQDFQ